MFVANVVVSSGVGSSSSAADGRGDHAFAGAGVCSRGRCCCMRSGGGRGSGKVVAVIVVAVVKVVVAGVVVEVVAVSGCWLV